MEHRPKQHPMFMTREESLAQLKTREGENAFRSLWNERIKHYGALGANISTNTTREYIDELADFLVTLKSLQYKMKGNSIERELYIFAGVAPLYEGKDDTKGVMKAHFDNLIMKAKINLVLFQTNEFRTYEYLQNECMANGISLWHNAPLIDQPTFVDTLKFRKSVTLPRGTGELLSMSMAVHEARYVFQVEPKIVIGHALDCTETLLVEMAETMCKASVEYQYRGGWAMFHVEYGDRYNDCGDTVFTAGYARLHWTKHYMTQSITSC